MVIISPPIFDLLFYTVVFLFGLDFSLSGFLILREPNVNFKELGLIGLWIIRRMNALYGSTYRSKLFSLLYSTRNMAIQTLIAGIFLIIAGLIMIVDIAMRIF